VKRLSVKVKLLILTAPALLASNPRGVPLRGRCRCRSMHQRTDNVIGALFVASRPGDSV